MPHYTDKDLARLQAHIDSTGSPDGFVSEARKKRKRDNEEWRIQSNFFRWWRSAAPGLGIWHKLFFHIPNGSMLGDDKQSRLIRARMLKLSGVESGVLDCFLAAPNFKQSGLWIEFKKPAARNSKNGGCSDEQMEFMGSVLNHGYAAHVCYSWEEAKAVTIEYLSI